MCAFRNGFYCCVVLLYIPGVQCILAHACKARCSRVIAPVCAQVAAGAASDRRLYYNDCHLSQVLCLLNKHDKVTVERLPDHACDVEKPATINGRRFVDHTIQGARTFCNHTCPTHCTDLYEPVCAWIWDQNSRNTGKHMLVNHCHADLLSCSLQLTVQILTIDYCIGTMTQFAYSSMAQAAVMKRLGLLDV